MEWNGWNGRYGMVTKAEKRLTKQKKAKGQHKQRQRNREQSRGRKKHNTRRCQPAHAIDVVRCGHAGKAEEEKEKERDTRQGKARQKGREDIHTCDQR
jgi:hypothetical protein